MYHALKSGPLFSATRGPRAPPKRRKRAPSSAPLTSFVVLNFQKAGKIDIPAVTLVIQIQHVARAKPAKVRLCFLEPALAGALEDRGGLRKEEVSGTLVEALKDFDFALKK